MNIPRLLISLLIKIYRWTLLPIFNLGFKLVYENGSTSVPPVKNPLLLRSATALAKMIRNKEVTCVEVLEVYIERTKLVNPLVNVVCADRYELALQQAQLIDEILNQDNIPDNYSEKNAPFLGVPLSVKEAFALTGMPNTSGLVARRGKIATKDADVVDYLRKSGAIPYVVTNVSELCMWYESANNVYGRSKNPYHTGRIVGGSSGQPVAK